ncbi:MAG TPA: hypothetical protein PLC00_02770 [Bacteroidales bacterium]|nr:hypothetical protein [Bacteroidales bacterium]
MKNTNIEVEGGEILIQSKEGHYAIIPAKHRQEVMDMVKGGCDGCINNYIQTLPKASDYAEDGSLYPEEPVINSDNPIKLPEVTITAEAPTYIKYKQAWEKENPFDIDKYVEDRFNNPVGREAISRINEKAWRKKLRKEGLKKRQAELDEATKMGLLYQRFNPQGKDDISIADEQFQKRYGTSPHRYRYDNDPEYKKYYEQQARNATSKIDYPSTDLRRKDFVAPNNMWMYPNLTGESKKAMTDFSNEVIGMASPIPGLEAMGKIPSVFKAGKKLIKPASKVLNKTDDITKNLKDLEYAKNYYSKYGYSIPENLAEIAKDSKLTDEIIQGLVNQHNTFVRGVSTNWDEIAKKNPEILRHLEGKGIDYINNPQAAAEYMSTHVPIQTGYGRAGLNENVFREGKDAIYTSNSIPTAEGYTYGDGYIVKVKRPTDFSSKNRIDWINNNKLDYFEDDLKTAPKEIKDKFLKLTEERYIKEIEPKYFDKNGNWKNGKVLQRELNYDNWVIEQEVRQELGLSVEKQYDLLKTEGSNKTYLEKINDNIIVPEQFLDRIGVPESSKIMTQIAKDVGKIYNPKLIKLEEDISKIRRQYPKDMVSKKRFGIDDYKIEDKYNKLLNELKSTREESILKVKEQQLKYLKDNYKDKLNEVDRYAHYLHVGKVGDKLLEPIEAIRITPDIWKNKSRAHTNVFSKGLSAGSLIPFYLYLQSQNQNKNEQ